MSAFDYSSLDPSVREEVRVHAGRLKALTKPDPVEVGKLLRRVKEALPHGMFGKWLRAECEWSQARAFEYIRVADTFGGNYRNCNFHNEVLVFLSSPHTPEPAREEAIRRAEKGEVITAPIAREIIARHKAANVAPPSGCAEPAPRPVPPRETTEPGDRPFLYGSICSGIEGASVAWQDLGWQPLFVAEIDPFARKVLRRHLSEVHNLGDVAGIGSDQVARLEELWTCSSGVRPANRSRSTVSEAAWRMSVASWPSSSFASLANAARDGLSGKTWQECSRSTEEGHLAPCSGGWSNAGMGSPTGSWTLASSEFPSDAVASSLSDIMEGTLEVPSSYFLTPQQLSRMGDRITRYGGKMPPELAPLFGAGPGTPRRSSAGT